MLKMEARKQLLLMVKNIGLMDFVKKQIGFMNFMAVCIMVALNNMTPNS